MTSPTFAELFGIMIGDGCLSHTGKAKGSGAKYWIYICGHREDDLMHHMHIVGLFKEVFNKIVKTQPRNDCRARFIRFSDKEIFHFFNSKGMPIGEKYEKLEIPQWIKENKEFKIAFLRGLFDTDGCFFVAKQQRLERYYPRIEIATKSKRLGEETLAALKDINIKSSLSRKGSNAFRLEVSGPTNVGQWMEIIGSNNQKHITKYIHWRENLSHLCGKPKAHDC